MNHLFFLSSYDSISLAGLGFELSGRVLSSLSLALNVEKGGSLNKMQVSLGSHFLHDAFLGCCGVWWGVYEC